MLAISVEPGKPGSARVEEVEDPAVPEDWVLVEAVALGVCGTDREIAAGRYGWAPPGRDRLVLGHESLGRVLTSPPGAGVRPGDLVSAVVRRPDPVPCLPCGLGEWDMCRNGRYTERGIKQLDGYGSQRWAIETEYTIPLDPSLGVLGVLVEPASVVAKAWEHIDRVGARAPWRPSRALVTGAGPIGLLAALLAVQRGLEVHVLDRVTNGPKPRLVAELGAEYHTGSVLGCPKPDVVVECTGAASVVFDAIGHTRPSGVVCLTGVSSGGRTIEVDAGAINRQLVLENDVVFGSVNANRRHYEAAATALAAADPAWLSGLITRRVGIERGTDALQPQAEDVKVVVDFLPSRLYG